MATPYETPIGSWTHQTTFLWTATGATVGLANLWQFPYLVASHGGALFIVLYLLCVLLVTLPLMVTESAMGRHSRHGIVLALDGYVRGNRRSSLWMWAGRLSILAAFLVLSFTAVFGAIAVAYVFYGAMGRFLGADEATATALLADLVANPRDYRLFMAWHGFFVLLVLWVSMQGVAQGLERALRIVVPGALLLLLGLAIAAGLDGKLSGAANVLLQFRPEQLSWQSLQAALFHAFFTLGLGMGVWTIFGAYSPAGTHLKRSILAVVLLDTLVAIVAGLLIYSVVAEGMADGVERGFGLLFVSLPVSLVSAPASQFLIAAVFLLVVLVVWTTSLALMEPVVGWFREWTGAPRGWAVFVVGVLVWLAGLGSLFSFNIWSDVLFAGGTVFRWLELLTSGLLIPLVSIMVALFAGWCLTRNLTFTILGEAPGLFRRVWFWVMRLVLPVVVAYIGIHYSLSSLITLCENRQTGSWCAPAEAFSEPLQEEGRENDAPEQSPEPNGFPDEKIEPRRQEAEHVPDASDDHEREPNGDDILYHSVLRPLAISGSQRFV